jgi:phage terminase small subunit
MGKLSDKQELFVSAYLKCFNATRAAIEAGYSADTAYSQGSRLLKHVEISARVRARLQEAAMSADEVLFHLADIARGNLGDMLDASGNIDMEKAYELERTGLIKRISQRAITTETSDIVEWDIEPYDRIKALELLGKHQGLFNTIKIEDWRTQAIADIRAGIIEYEALADAFDVDLATQLFHAAGVPVVSE